MALGELLIRAEAALSLSMFYALHRLTEIYLVLGLMDQAKRTAAVLGHNYPGNPWYQDSYANLADNGMAPQVADRPGSSPGLLSRTFGSLF